MSVVAYKQPSSLPPQRTDLTQPQYQNAPQHVDPMVYLYNLEREIEMSERRTASVMNDLASALITWKPRSRMSAVDLIRSIASLKKLLLHSQTGSTRWKTPSVVSGARALPQRT